MTAYLIDTNVFIHAKNVHYGFDFCPAFWDWLETRNGFGQVASVDEVAVELRRKRDDLSQWAEARGRGFFLKPDSSVVSAMNAVADFLVAARYLDMAAKGFMERADAWLVAHALAHGRTVVTHEIEAASVKRIKIPNVCLGLDVPYIAPHKMLRRERARFVLDRGAEVG